MINQVSIQGRLGKTPEVQHIGSRELYKFSIANRETWKDKNSGEWKEKTYWINVEAVFGATKVAAHLSKGDMVNVFGKLVTGSYENAQTGVRTTFTKVVATNIQKIEYAKASNEEHAF